MSRYLITGGLGFIGGHLAHALCLVGHSVRILDDLSTGHRDSAPSACEVQIGDVSDPAAVAGAMTGMEGCFHLAAIASVERSNEAWAACHRVNLGGTVNILEAARDAGKVPVVYASSAAVYGEHPEGRLNEDSATRPLNAYGADKLGGELHAAVATRLHGVPTTALRFFNVYGPGQDPNSPYSGVISIFAQRIMAGEPVVIHGDGRQSRDFVYVGDVVHFLVAAMATTSTRPLILNVCTGRATSVEDLATTIGDLANRGVEKIQRDARPGDIRASVGNPRLAAHELGLRATTLLPEGLGKTLAAIDLSRTELPSRPTISQTSSKATLEGI